MSGSASTPDMHHQWKVGLFSSGLWTMDLVYSNYQNERNGSPMYPTIYITVNYGFENALNHSTLVVIDFWILF